MKLKEQLDELEKIIETKEILNEEISKRGTYWHADHVLKVYIGVLKSLIKSDPSAYRWKFNASRAYIFARNSIPRGAGKSPSSVNVLEEIKQEDLREQLEISRSLLARFEELNAKSNFDHPVFGTLNKAQTRKFLVLHTRHHLKIIYDIIGK